MICNTDQVLHWLTNTWLREKNLLTNAMINLIKSTHQYRIKQRILRITFHNNEIVHCSSTNKSFSHRQGKIFVPHIWFLGKDKLKRAYFNLDCPFRINKLSFLWTTVGSKHLPRKVLLIERMWLRKHLVMKRYNMKFEIC